jgi:inosine-uridine nucleoside N-ribohydrolase
MPLSLAKHRVIFDTDPGVDDAIALYFALAHPDIDVIGITTTFGNVSVRQATANALYLTRLAGRHIPVAQGVAEPLHKAPGKHPDFVHGTDGLGNLENRFEVGGQAEPVSAAEFIVDMARKQPGEITLVAVGPFGNLALALELEPRLPELLKQVVVMGGAIDEPGNVSPVAEANVWNDPHAADIVFTTGWDLTMVGLDVTHRVILPSASFDRLARHHRHAATDMLRHSVAFYSRFYNSIRPDMGNGCYGHDVLTFVWLVAPELFTRQAGRIRVATEGIGNGQTMMARAGFSYQQAGWEADRPETRVCMDVDATACAELVESTLLRQWPLPPLANSEYR